MGGARKTLAIVAFAAMVGCTVKSPASTPAILLSTPRLHSTPATFNLLGWIQSEAGQVVVSESYTPLP